MRHDGPKTACRPAGRRSGALSLCDAACGLRPGRCCAAPENICSHTGTNFPEYDPENDTLRRCTTDGGFVQIH